MTSHQPKSSYDQPAGGQTPDPGSQQAALDALTSLFEEAARQAQQAQPPALSAEVQKAVAEYDRIKQALGTPEIGRPIPEKERWNLPPLNETAKPR